MLAEIFMVLLETPPASNIARGFKPRQQRARVLARPI
jgi:hypothetical protein